MKSRAQGWAVLKRIGISDRIANAERPADTSAYAAAHCRSHVQGFLAFHLTIPPRGRNETFFFAGCSQWGGL